MPTRTQIARYIAYFEALTPASLDDLHTVCDEAVHFRDPFNDTRGLVAMRRVFNKMFDDVHDAQFAVLDQAISSSHAVCYLRWRFTGKATIGAVVIEGVSEIRFGDDGRAVAHIDHWDAAGQLYERMPVIGRVLRWMRGRAAA